MQGNKRILAAISGLASLFVSISSFADPAQQCGWYVEGNAGKTYQTGKSYPVGTSNNTNGWGGNVDLGYKFMPYLGAEIGYTQYAATKINVSNTQAGQDKHYGWDIAAKGMLPIGGYGFEPFAKVGATRLYSKTTISNTALANSVGLTAINHNSNGLYMAVGIAYNVMPELAVNVQYARANGTSSVGTMSLLSGGLTFLFG